MGLFRKRNPPDIPKNQQLMYSAARHSGNGRLSAQPDIAEAELYRRLRFAVPIVDAAIHKIIRLTGDFRLVCSDSSMQKSLDCFVKNVPVGASMR